MRRTWTRTFWTFILSGCIGLLLLMGSSMPTPVAPQPSHWLGAQPDSKFEIIRFDTMEQSAQGFSEWVSLIEAAHPDGAIIVIGHGWEMNGFWTIMPTRGFLSEPDVTTPMPLAFLVASLRADRPFTPIVILSCNPEHDPSLAQIPNCYYAMDSLWIVPDEFDPMLHRVWRHLMNPGDVGRLEDFVWSGPSASSH